MTQNILRFIFGILVLPLLLLWDLFRAIHSGWAKFGYVCLIILFFGLTWIQGYRNLFSATALVGYQTGLLDKEINLPVSGTSMTPTILNGSKIDLHNPKKYGLARGDIVSFQNIETSNAHYLKRIIGLPGETILLKNGQVYINDQALTEPYVNHQEPTLGNTYLIDCVPYKIPAQHFAVLGDNRTVSVDSRVLGFIDQNDIDGVIKSTAGPGFNPPAANNLQAPAQFDPEALITGLNQKRQAHKSQPFAEDTQLNTVAQERADFVGTHFSSYKTDAAPISSLLDQVGYKYLTVQELVTFGALSTPDLIDQILESPMYQDSFLSNQYVAIGLGTAAMQQNTCSIPVIVAIIAQPTSPGYGQSTLDQWNQNIAIMTRIASALKAVQYKPGIDTQLVGQLLDQVDQELQQANQTLTKLKAQQWFSAAEIQAQEQYFKDIQATQSQLDGFVTDSKKSVKDPEVLSLLDQVEPGDPAYNQKAGQVKLLFAQGKFDELKTGATELLNLSQTDSEKAGAHYWLGLSAYSLQKYPEAEAEETQATTLDPQYAAAYSTLSAIKLGEKKYPEAITLAQTCITLDPTYSWCHNNLGIAYVNLGQKDKGVAELKQAVKLDPENYSINDNLKRVLALP